MITKNKSLEYYFDSRIYSIQEVRTAIEENKKEFSNKIVEAQISLNPFGVYIVTLNFKDKNNLLTKIKPKKTEKNKNKVVKHKEQKRLEKYYGENKYGQYKSAGVYRPY